MKWNIQLIGRRIIVVFDIFLSKLIQHCMKQIRKHGPTLTLSFSRNINSYEIFFQMIN